MFFKSFRLQNFKGISDITINVEDINAPMVLLGLNESGKTTILKGIELIGEHCKKITEKEVITNGRFFNILPKVMLFSGDVELSCVLMHDNKEMEIRFVYKVKGMSFDTYEVFICGEKYNYEADNTIANAIAQNVPDILYFDDFMLDVPREIVFQTSEGIKSGANHDLLKTTSNLKWQGILDDVFKSLKKPEEGFVFQKNVVDYLDNNPGAENGFEQTISALQGKINKEIVKKWISALKSNAALKEVKISYTRKEGIISFSIQVKAKNETVFEFSERSKGCRWFFSFMLFTEFRRHRSKHTVFLLDEPASNMHGFIQKEIIKAITQLGKETKVIYSTHSPYLLDIKNIENCYVVKNLNSDSEVKKPKIEINKIINEEVENNKYILPLLDHVLFSMPDFINELNKDKNADKSSNNKNQQLVKLEDGIKKFIKKLFEKIMVGYTSDKVEQLLNSVYKLVLGS